jgi:hypothetical protein
MRLFFLQELALFMITLAYYFRAEPVWLSYLKKNRK